MKKILSGLLAVVLSTSVYASPTDTVMAENLRIAKTFCLTNTECADVIALELDDAYRKGLKDQDSKRPWNVLVNRQTKELTTLCDNAPKAEICSAYRNSLIARYMAGLSDK